MGDMLGQLGPANKQTKNPHIHSFISNSAADATVLRTEDIIKISVYYKHTDVHIAATVALTCCFHGFLDARPPVLFHFSTGKPV